MSGITRLLAKELSSALGITDNPKFNPMFKQTDEVMTDVADPSDPTVARFYSPLESALDEAPIGKEGTRGENVEAFVRKRAPKVTKGEMEFRGLGLEPGELYTAESAKESLGALEVKAIKLEPGYTPTQRQRDLLDEEIDYVELGLAAKGSKPGKLPGLEVMDHYAEGFSKYPDSILAHSRYSVRQGDDSTYMFIEELQSDSVQGIVADPVGTYKTKQKEFYSLADKEINDIVEEVEFDIGEGIDATKMREAVRRYEDILSNSKDTKADFEKFNLDYGIEEAYAKALANNSSIHFVLGKLVPSTRLSDDVSDQIDMKIQNIQQYATKPLKATKQTIDSKQSPITRTTDYVRMLLQSVISDAKSRGIDEIVIPPVEEIAVIRTGSKTVPKDSPFYATYQAAVDKVLKQLKSELGNQIKIGKKPLKYRSSSGKIKARTAKGKVLNVPDKYETVQGTLLDISNLTMDPKNTKLRFNTGGLVQRRTK